MTMAGSAPQRSHVKIRACAPRSQEADAVRSSSLELSVQVALRQIGVPPSAVLVEYIGPHIALRVTSHGYVDVGSGHSHLWPPIPPETSHTTLQSGMQT